MDAPHLRERPSLGRLSAERVRRETSELRNVHVSRDGKSWPFRRILSVSEKDSVGAWRCPLVGISDKFHPFIPAVANVSRVKLLGKRMAIMISTQFIAISVPRASSSGSTAILLQQCVWHPLVAAILLHHEHSSLGPAMSRAIL